jgi:hypothetical protein
MAKVLALTDAPARLLRAMQLRAADEGFDTWELDSDGDLRHTSEQYRSVGYFRISEEEDGLSFTHAFFKDAEADPAKAAQMQGHLIAMLLTHFRERFSLLLAA